MFNTHLNNISYYQGTTDLDKQINTAPHYTDSRYKKEQTEFCLWPEKLVNSYETLVIDGLHYDYSDRLWEWDREKMKEAYTHADTIFSCTKDDWRKRQTARYLQEVLRFYYNKPELVLIHIVAGVNKSNGYPYLVFGSTYND